METKYFYKDYGSMNASFFLRVRSSDSYLCYWDIIRVWKGMAEIIYWNAVYSPLFITDLKEEDWKIIDEQLFNRMVLEVLNGN